jgi:hypothetical protein
VPFVFRACAQHLRVENTSIYDKIYIQGGIVMLWIIAAAMVFVAPIAFML